MYRRLLGPAWHELDAAIRRFHSPRGGLRASGIFPVAHGRYRMARLLAGLLRLPAEGEAVALRLSVQPSQDAEVWRRRFERRTIVTRQTASSSGLLVEQIGLLELHFELTVADGSLRYRQTAAGLRLLSNFSNLPKWLAPRVVAMEQPGEQRNSVSVTVTVSLPGVGILLSYNGAIEVQETEGWR